MHARDLLDAVLDSREHPQPEQVDLQEARVGARVLVPLHHLPARHRARLHGDELDERPGRDHHAARMLRDVARQAGDLGAQLGERAPARGAQLRLGVRQQRELFANARCVPAVGDPCEPLEIRERQPERLADVTDRAARAIRRERRDERGVLAPVLLRHAHDQLLADVAGEVEVDVGHRRQLVVEEASERQVGRDGIHVREPGQVADDRADGRAAAPSRRQYLPCDRLAAYLPRHVARELEHLPVQQEEACEPDPLDQVELVLETPPRAPLVPVEIRVALPEQSVAERAQLCDRRRVAVREVRIAVAELLRQIELEPLRELGRARNGVSVVGKPLVHLLGREQHRLVVAAPLALAAVQRRAVVDGDERVLQAEARARVCVGIAGRDGRDAERLGEIA